MGSTGSKIKEKIYINCFKTLPNKFNYALFFVKNETILGPIISRTKYDRNKPFFSAER